MISKWGGRVKTVIEKYYFFLSAMVLLIASFNCFYHSGAERVWDWDESLDGVTAYEMLQNHNFVVSTYAHQIITYDYANQIAVWNFKPPLGWWFIILGFKLFGFNAFGLRFYSGFFCFLSVLLVMWFMAKEVGKIPALLSGFMLATTAAMVFIHGARSGDLSPMFTFLVLLFTICLLRTKKKPFYLYLTGFVFSLCFLVYSFASFYLVVLALVYGWVTGDYKNFSLKNYFLSLLCAVLPIGFWVIWRLCNAGGWDFFKGMISYDLIRRSTQSLEGHGSGFYYYLIGMTRGDPYWSIFAIAVIISFLAVIGFKLDWKNRPLALSSLAVFVPLVLFTLARTKLGWYMIPTHPPSTIAVGCLAWTLFNNRRCQTAGKTAILVLFLIVGLGAERDIYKEIQNPAQETSQNLLDDFKKTNYSPDSALYSKGLDHGTFFVAEVVCGLNPISVKEFKECLGRPGFLMLVKDAKGAENSDFVASHHLPVIVENQEWMIVKL